MDTDTDLRACGGADAYLRSCPSHAVLAAISDKWTMLTLTALRGAGVMRYGDLKRRLDGISPKMLSQTLRHLERDGLVTRTQFPTIPPKVTYELTPLGLELGGLFDAVKQWSEAHHPAMQAAREAYDSTAEAAAEAAG